MERLKGLPNQGVLNEELVLDDGRVTERSIVRMTDLPSPIEAEIRTRRLVITDDNGAPRIVGEVINDVAELRVELDPAGHSNACLLLYAIPDISHVLGSQLGVQLWADGNIHAEMNLVRQHHSWSAECVVSPGAEAAAGRPTDPNLG